jgi:hypothetical protein
MHTLGLVTPACVLTAQILHALRSVFTSVCADFESQRVEFDGEDDHVHLLVNYPPKIAVAASLHEIRYGKTVALDQYYTGPNAFSITTFYESINNPRYATNLELGYTWRGFQWIVRADNLFNVYPKELPPAQRYLGAARFRTRCSPPRDPAPC